MVGVTRGNNGRTAASCLRTIEASGPPGPPRGHNTRQLHAMTPGLVGQTIERTGGSKQMRTVVADAKAQRLHVDNRPGRAPR
jgi:hypothetical protein